MVDAAKLKDLIERVEAATGPDRKIDAALCRYFDIPQCHEPDCSPSTLERIIRRVESGEWDQDSSVPFYTASIDAALALVERVRPGWAWTVTSSNAAVDGRPWANLDERYLSPTFEGADIDASAATPALAITLALLRSIEGGDE